MTSGDSENARNAATSGASAAERAFRGEWGRAVAVVTRLTGDLAAAEDAVQEAVVKALGEWSAGKPPDDPGAWLITVAKRHAVDRIRREAKRGEKEEAAMALLAASGPPEPTGMVTDDRLRLVFTCCHPALEPGVRVALTLRTLCGLTTAEIAAVFLTTESAMAQRLVRAKRKIRDAAIPYRVPQDHELPDRVTAVLRVVYLVFTSGHRNATSESLIRSDLCEEAVRLARLLAALCPDDPEALGLLALLLLTDARRAARTDPDGNVVPLAEQDRGLWDRAAIAEGVSVLDRATAMRQPGPYQLQAAIAACHATTPTAADTDWAHIAALYTALAGHDPSPVIQANRAVAVARSEGDEAGLEILDRLAHDSRLRTWPLLHAARADFLRRLGRTAEAADAYRAALDLNPPPAERDLLARCLDDLTAREKGR